MHFVTGGAYNGKKSWVTAHYALDVTEHVWLNAYKEDDLRQPTDQSRQSTIIVLEGVEQWIYTYLRLEQSTDSLLKSLQSELNKWLEWEEQSRDHQLIMIGADITKGIVPIEKQDRYWRDITGWIYQYVAKQAERVDVIWYGIAEKIK